MTTALPLPPPAPALAGKQVRAEHIKRLRASPGGRASLCAAAVLCRIAALADWVTDRSERVGELQCEARDALEQRHRGASALQRELAAVPYLRSALHTLRRQVMQPGGGGGISMRPGDAQAITSAERRLTPSFPHNDAAFPGA